MHAVLIVRPGTDTDAMVAALSRLPGIQTVTPLVWELRAVAFIRAQRPDVIFLHTDACADDETGLLTWLRSHRESPHTLLVRAGTASDRSIPLPRIPGVPSFDLPRDRTRLSELLEAFAPA